MLLDLFSKQTKEQYFDHAAKQSWIGLALYAAAIEKVDTKPMEDFDGKAPDKLLELNKKKD